MKRLLLAATLAFTFATGAQAGNHNLASCGLDSKYDVSLDGSGLQFTREDGKPARIVMNKGSLRIDGREVSLGEADRDRIAEYEATVRALIPQAKGIARDAVDIAYTAVSEVAAAFSSTADSSAARQRLGVLRDEFKQRVDDSFDKNPWNEHEFDQIAEQAMTDLMPVIIGEVVGSAVSIALSGDEAAAKELEQRAEKIERDILRRIDTQTGQLAARVATLCPMMAKLDRLESALDIRVDGSRINLFDLED
ncbi:DUF2884 family protein [Tahibacter harae]|uniref:YggN family protein n=1 Tax=Tahibacter harae TaxID=2963937 RepID=A0ABT1QNA7_9GAMM|nr:DUF2884 family protein [Tahibacter harae]MCQ4164016.1 YggN family protein [Tahibacter harae]